MRGIPPYGRINGVELLALDDIQTRHRRTETLCPSLCEIAEACEFAPWLASVLGLPAGTARPVKCARPMPQFPVAFRDHAHRVTPFIGPYGPRQVEITLCLLNGLLPILAKHQFA